MYARILQKATAPSIFQKVPEMFCCSFIILISLCLIVIIRNSQVIKESQNQFLLHYEPIKEIFCFCLRWSSSLFHQIFKYRGNFSFLSAFIVLNFSTFKMTTTIFAAVR
ncbi:hypothetical protein MSLAZ_2129 [Methanosarcina lacustris Z-7289]|uniref:Uncharacterized protein n=1 Tax=Methanosarcina lacustris Z-7289 TaxID=1434111 RepID=A0A0E3WT12_9EURY|nr:hypothetical protein MSLAZ_2129 [Methanosarcina lacustris Z-7289]